MSPLVFKTYEDSSEDVDVVGVGRLFSGGRGGVPVADAANIMTELQEKNPDGSAKLDKDGNPVPLTGSKLTNAAKDFADLRGFTTVNVAESAIAGLPQEAGVAPDRPPAADSAHEDYLRAFGEGPLETVNANPDELTNPGSSAGVPVLPETPDNPALADPTDANPDTTPEG